MFPVQPHAAGSFGPPPGLSAGPVTERSVIYLNENGSSIAFGNPLMSSERKFVSLVMIWAFHLGELSSFEEKVRAMTPIVDVFQTCAGFTFVSQGVVVAEPSKIAEAVVGWIRSSPELGLTPSHMIAIENIVLDQQMDSQEEHIPVAMAPPSFDMSYSSSSDRSVEQGDQQEDFSSTKRRKLSRYEEPETGFVAEQYTRNKRLFEELERVQSEVGRRPENDVHRGKGQGVKNKNARRYTPLIASRAMEYSSINGSNKNRADESKQAIALEILIELAREGGRIRDVDNTRVLSNKLALKKVMNALKDKSREMKKKGGLSGSGDEDTQQGETICLAQRTAENVELLKMLRRSNSSTPV